MASKVRPKTGSARAPARSVRTGGVPRILDRYEKPLPAADSGPVSFKVLAEPVGWSCNQDCAYGCGVGRENLAAGPGPAQMTEATLERFIRQYLEAVTAPVVTFTWQGGEPTLQGLEFFRQAVVLQKRYARPGQPIQNDLWTNGLLLDDAWCAFLRRNQFLVGVGLDGPKALHDRCRVDRDGQPTFDRAMRSVRLLQRYGIPVTTLTRVHRGNARWPTEIYRFLRDEVGSDRMKFLPLVAHPGFAQRSPQAGQALGRLPEGAPGPGQPGLEVTEWSVDPDDWGQFLCSVFDQWINWDVGRINVDQFEALVAEPLGLPARLCVYAETCGQAPALGPDGSLRSCEHFPCPDYRIGSLDDEDLRQVALSRPQAQFGRAKSADLPGQCRRCPYLRVCWGECPKNRILRTAEGEPGLNYLCRGLQRFFAHALPQIATILAQFNHSQAVIKR